MISNAGRLLSVLLVVACGAPLASTDDAKLPASWKWLESARASKDGMLASPTLGIEERAKASGMARSVLALAYSPTRGRPEGSRIVGAGVIVRRDGLVAASWQVLSEVDNACWLWARLSDGRWVRAIPMSATWWGDVGLCRLVTARRDLQPVTKASISKKDFRKRYVGIGTARGKALVAAVGRLETVRLFDPDAANGQREASRAWSKSRGEPATVIALHFEASLATQGGAGTPVFEAATGKCVGLVTATWSGSGKPARVVARPWSYLENFLAPILRDVVFDPPDLGVRWGPSPTRHGEAALASPELLRSRDYVSGGALVKYVLPDGPANRILWEGDVVVEIEGRPVFGEVYESVALAMLGLHAGVPADVVVVRGGELQTLQVTAKRLSAIYPDYDEHDARATQLPRAHR